MDIVSLTPIAYLPQKQQAQLSYFSKEPTKPGSLVVVNLRGRKIFAIVNSAQNLSQQKIKVKKSGFTLKKIQSIASKNPPFPLYLIDVAQQLANYYLEPAGSILKAFIPTILLEGAKQFIFNNTSDNPFSSKHSELIIGSREERITHHETIIRESFAKGMPVAFFAPTLALVQYYFNAYSRLPKKPIIISSAIPKKTLIRNIALIRDNNQPYIIIGTPLALACLSGRERIIIVEDADSLHYIRDQHPYIDMKRGIELYAEHTQARYIESGKVPALKNLLVPPKPHFLSAYQNKQKEYQLVDVSSRPWAPLSPEVIKLLSENDDKRMILFVSRKGFYTFIICQDCGTILYCSDCKKPLITAGKNQTHYICRHCLKKYTTDMPCQKCESWNVKGYGIGTDRIYAEITKNFQGRPCWIFDDQHIKTDAVRKSIEEAFLKSKNGIIVGTDLLLETPGIVGDYAIVINFDNLFSIPDFQIHERILHILASLQEKAKTTPLIIQTRFPKHPIFHTDMKKYLLEELEERHSGHLPPFTICIKITIKHKNPTARAELVKKIIEYLAPYKLTYSSYSSITDQNAHFVLLIVDRKRWREDEQELKHALSSCTIPCDIAVDPVNIL